MTENKSRSSVDVITHNPKTDEYKLIIVKAQKFCGTESALLELQKKINDYLIFILDGQMEKMYPNSKGKSKCIQIDYSHDLDDNTTAFLEKIKYRLRDENINLYLNKLS